MAGKNVDGLNQQELEKLIEEAQERLKLIRDVPCDACGANCVTGLCKNFEGLSFTITWGYDSSMDGWRHALNICEECYKKHILNGPLGGFIKATHYMEHPCNDLPSSLERVGRGD